VSNNNQSRLRDVIFRYFLLICSVLIIGAALLLFGSARLTEDFVLRKHLENHLHTSVEYTGSLADMPAHLQAQLQTLPAGFSELESGNREIQVLKQNVGNTFRYALIATTDTNYVPLTGGLIVGAAIALLFAYGLSSALSRHLTSPLEQIVNDLEANKWDTDTVPTYELAVLSDRIRSFQAEQAHRLRREVGFTRSVSHELRTPMTVLQGALELLQDEAHSESQAPRLQRMRFALATLEQTTEALLALTRNEHRIVNRGMTLQQSLNEIIAENIAEDTFANSDDNSLKSEFTCNLPNTFVDWPLLVVAVGLLVHNVATHAKASVVSVRVNDEHVEVSDDGIGIANPSAMVNNQQAGSHLGFGILHRICERCDWQLSIESAPGTGTTVRLSFRHDYAGDASQSMS